MKELHQAYVAPDVVDCLYGAGEVDHRFRDLIYLGSREASAKLSVVFAEAVLAAVRLATSDPQVEEISGRALCQWPCWKACGSLSSSPEHS